MDVVGLLDAANERKAEKGEYNFMQKKKKIRLKHFED